MCLLREVDRRRIAGPEESHRRDLDPSPRIFRSVVEPRSTSQEALSHPGRLSVLPRVVVEVKLQLCGRNARDVSPGQDFSARQGAALRVQPNVDGIVGVAWRRGPADRTGRFGGRLGRDQREAQSIGGGSLNCQPRNETQRRDARHGRRDVCGGWSTDGHVSELLVRSHARRGYASYHSDATL